MKKYTVQEIKNVAEAIEGFRKRVAHRQNPYNLFTAYKMS